MIPRALYKLARQPGFDPVVMTPGLATHTSRQIRDFVFCWECEQRFSQKGEDYVMRLLPRNGSFPLLDRLEFVRIPISVTEGIATYATTKTEIDTRIIAYFALSVLGEQRSTAGLHSANKRLRLNYRLKRWNQCEGFWLVRQSFPARVNIVMTVSMDAVSQGHVLSPHGIVNEAKSISRLLLVRGIYFRLMFDPSFRQACAVRSSGRFVFVDNSAQETLDTLNYLKESAKIAQNLKRKR